MLLAASDVIWTGLIAAISAPAAALLIGRQLNRQRKAEKDEDYARQDKVAEAAEAARVKLAENNKLVADEAARQQAQVAEVAAGAAKLLRDAQATTRSDADEVARVAAEKGGSSEVQRSHSSKLLAVVVSHPSGVQRTVELDGIPSVGQHILLRGARQGDQPQRVANVLWVEANGGRSPSVIVVVCPAERGTQLLSDATTAARQHDDDL